MGIPARQPTSNDGVILARQPTIDKQRRAGMLILPSSPDNARVDRRAYRKYGANDAGQLTGLRRVVFLGLGENGHTASLFPGSTVLAETERWVAETYVAEQDLHRITLTAPIFNQSELIVFLVSGQSKSAVLREVLEGPFSPWQLPAQLIRPRPGNLLWLVDQPAAARFVTES